MWRLLATLFALALAASACGSSDSSDDSSASGSSSDAEETEVTLAANGESLLDTVKSRGTLNCGVSGSAVAFSELQADGSMAGFDADYCRVVAAAILGDANKVNFVSLTAAERFTAVQTGDVDLLMRNTTWTQSRDSEVGMDFGPTTYYDGQQLMGRESDGFSGSSQVSDVGGSVICTSAGTTTEKNIADAAAEAGVSIELQTFEDFDTVTNNFISGACDIITTDGSALVGRKAKQQPDGENWVIFPATPISKEPLGPLVRHGDNDWGDIARWTLNALITAEELGVTSANMAEMAAGTNNPEINRLLGTEGNLGEMLGLDAEWAKRAIMVGGNYGEVFESNIGSATIIGLARGLNSQWTNGGLIYSPPFR